MQTYVFFFTDSRYPAPQLIFATVASKSRALELAERELARSKHYVSVEVREGSTVHYRLKRDGDKEFYPNPLEV